MNCFRLQKRLKVHCRIGSLEKSDSYPLFVHQVHCRIGSLENLKAILTDGRDVHCRIGSLEMSLHCHRKNGFCSLPDRQLRNECPRIFNCGKCSLPDRQLRNPKTCVILTQWSSLPDRQLRKCKCTPMPSV